MRYSHPPTHDDSFQGHQRLQPLGSQALHDSQISDHQSLSQSSRDRCSCGLPPPARPRVMLLPFPLHPSPRSTFSALQPHIASSHNLMNMADQKTASPRYTLDAFQPKAIDFRARRHLKPRNASAPDWEATIPERSDTTNRFRTSTLSCSQRVRDRRAIMHADGSPTCITMSAVAGAATRANSRDRSLRQMQPMETPDSLEDDTICAPGESIIKKIALLTFSLESQFGRDIQLGATPEGRPNSARDSHEMRYPAMTTRARPKHNLRPHRFVREGSRVSSPRQQVRTGTQLRVDAWTAASPQLSEALSELGI